MPDQKERMKEATDIPVDRKQQRQRGSGIFTGLVLIVLGLSLFTATHGWISWESWWQYFLIGIGVVFILSAFIRSFNPEKHRGLVPRLVTGIFLICIGTAFIFGLSNWWPIILIAVGIAVIIGVFARN
jgi:asparagine N-glycosylation enzyme membrane subunit Stt3